MVDSVTWELLTTIDAPVVTETLGSYEFGFGSAVSLVGQSLIVTSELYGMVHLKGYILYNLIANLIFVFV